MRRLAWLVPRAKVQLSDVNGPRGGVDKRCRVELSTDGAGTGGHHLASLATGAAALDSALARAATRLGAACGVAAVRRTALTSAPWRVER